MVSKRSQQLPSSTLAGKLTACLTKGLNEQLGPVRVALMVAKGFELSDVRAMISLSPLYSTPLVSAKILGKPPRSVQRQRDASIPIRLSAWQSAVAFQYAIGLERAECVFGTLAHAEAWLCSPCKYLDGLVPVDLFVNAIGFQAVMDYLSRVEMGVYQ